MPVIPLTKRNRAVIATLALLALFSFYVALVAGTVPIGGGDLWALLGDQGDQLARRVILELRLPRAVTGFVVGAMLALAGALLQVLLRNPLADPFILGISGGAAVGALLAMLAGAAGWLVTGCAAGGALFSMLAVFGLAHGHGSWSATRLLLTGVVMAAGWGAVVSFILAVAPQQSLRGMLFWLMGDLSHASRPGFAVVVLLVALAVTMVQARSLNLLARGEMQAGVLGVRTRPLRITVYFLASVLTATAVTLAGSVGFVGLVVPHMLRLVGVTDHRRLLPAAALLGGSLLLLADTLARTVIAPQQLPVGVLTAMIGVPLFLLLLYQGART